MLPNTLLDMKRSLYEVDFVSIMNESDVDGLCNVQVPESRDEKVKDLRELGWVLDFSLDSVVNVNLRKTDLENFAVFNEGNLYNNLFYKVILHRYQQLLIIHRATFILFYLKLFRDVFSLQIFWCLRLTRNTRRVVNKVEITAVSTMIL